MSNKNILHSVWDESVKFIASSSIEIESLKLNALLSSVFCSGPFYFYVVDFYDRQIKYMHESIRDVFNVEPSTTTFDDILGRIHPDDMPFVANAEKRALEYIYEKIGREKVLMYKVSYCFRMKIHDGSYELFQHQSLTLTADENWRFGKALNIHTNISHLTNENSYCISMVGMNGEPSFFNIEVPGFGVQATESVQSLENKLSSRELEIIKLIAEGKTNELIAKELYLSVFTIKNHRKNIFKKLQVKSSNALVSLCLTKGII